MPALFPDIRPMHLVCRGQLCMKRHLLFDNAQSTGGSDAVGGISGGSALASWADFGDSIH